MEDFTQGPWPAGRAGVCKGASAEGEPGLISTPRQSAWVRSFITYSDSTPLCGVKLLQGAASVFLLSYGKQPRIWFAGRRWGFGVSWIQGRALTCLLLLCDSEHISYSVCLHAAEYCSSCDEYITLVRCLRALTQVAVALQMGCSQGPGAVKEKRESSLYFLPS